MKSPFSPKAIGLLLALAASIFALTSNYLAENRYRAAPLKTLSPTPALTSPATTSACRSAGGLPDPACTPGATDPRVTQTDIRQTICVQGYTRAVRPPLSVTEPLKRRAMARYNDTGSPKDYELDHLIPLELGGHPDSELNLWPEAYSPSPGAHEKDKVENYLRQQVCLGLIPLAQAQQEIATNWLAIYTSLP